MIDIFNPNGSQAAGRGIKRGHSCVRACPKPGSALLQTDQADVAVVDALKSVSSIN